MNIKKRSVISVLTVFAMILSFGTFTACDNETEKKPDEKNVHIHIKIASSAENFFCDDEIELPENSTVLTATEKICENKNIAFSYSADEGAEIEGIKSDINEIAETEEGEETETEESEAEIEIYHVWNVYVNGKSAETSVILKEGDSIEWKWEEIKVSAE